MPEPKQIFVITDPGRDPDDEVLFVQLSGLIRLGMAEVAGAVVNQSPLEQRANLASATFNAFSRGIPSGVFDVKSRIVKGLLKTLKMDKVPVAMGSEGDVSHKLRPYEFDVPYLGFANGENIYPDGHKFIKDKFLEARNENKKISLLLVSGMKDADIFINENPGLACEVLEQVVIMGGVEVDANGYPVFDEEGFVVPDNAANNKFGSHENDDPGDSVSKYARSLYRNLQKLDIPTEVISRHAAYKVQVSGDYYAKLAETKHPVGLRVRDMQKAAITGLFHDVTQKGGHPNPRLTPEWFASTFLKNPEADLQALLQDTEDIMGRIKGFNPYDPLTALSVFFPGLFDPYLSARSDMKVIGLSSEHHGIASVDGVHKLLEYLPRAGFGIEPRMAWSMASLRQASRPEVPEEFRQYQLAI